MSLLAPWQRALRLFGDLVLIAGVVWALYLRFALNACPAGTGGLITPYSMMIGGLMLSTIATHPFGRAAYLRPLLKRLRWLAVLYWAVALLGGIAGLCGVTRGQLQLTWLLAALPLLLYAWLALENESSPKARADGEKHGQR